MNKSKQLPHHEPEYLSQGEMRTQFDHVRAACALNMTLGLLLMVWTAFDSNYVAGITGGIVLLTSLIQLRSVGILDPEL